MHRPICLLAYWYMDKLAKLNFFFLKHRYIKKEKRMKKAKCVRDNKLIYFSRMIILPGIFDAELSRGLVN